MKYPVAIEWGDDDTATGIVIPDIPGAITAGDDVDQAFELALEVAQIQLEELVAAGEEIPKPSRIEDVRRRPEFAGWGWGYVDIDLTPYLGATEKVNVTLPGVVIAGIDAYVSKHSGKSRSAFLADVAIKELGIVLHGKGRAAATRVIEHSPARRPNKKPRTLAVRMIGDNKKSRESK